MDIRNLSSNWKELQKSLKTSEIPDRQGSGKRKSNGVEATTQVNGHSATFSSKKRRLNQQSPRESKTSTSSTTCLQNRTNLPGTGRKSNSERRKMGFLFSRPVESGASNDHEAKSENLESIIPSNAIEDVSESQRSLVCRPSGTMLRQTADTINSGLVAGVRAGKYISLDCEMVGVGPLSENRSMLARASLVNFMGEQLYDAFVTPKESITDYRTAVSGITSELLRDARSFETVQREVADLLQGRVLIGHAVRNDLDALMLGHPKRDIRDTSRHKSYRDISGGRTPALKRLAREILGIEIQGGAHSSIEDARTTMLLFKREKDVFEREHNRKYGVDRRQYRSQLIDGEMNPVKEQAMGKPKVGKSKKRKKRKR